MKWLRLSSGWRGTLKTRDRHSIESLSEVTMLSVNRATPRLMNNNLTLTPAQTPSSQPTVVTPASDANDREVCRGAGCTYRACACAMWLIQRFCVVWVNEIERQSQGFAWMFLRLCLFDNDWRTISFQICLASEQHIQASECPKNDAGCCPSHCRTTDCTSVSDRTNVRKRTCGMICWQMKHQC